MIESDILKTQSELLRINIILKAWHLALDVLLKKIYMSYEMTVLQWNCRHGGREGKSSNVSCGTWVKLCMSLRLEAPREGFPGHSLPLAGALILPTSFLPSSSLTPPVASAPFLAALTLEAHIFYLLQLLTVTTSSTPLTPCSPWRQGLSHSSPELWNI